MIENCYKYKINVYFFLLCNETETAYLKKTNCIHLNNFNKNSMYSNKYFLLILFPIIFGI